MPTRTAALATAGALIFIAMMQGTGLSQSDAPPSDRLLSFILGSQTSDGAFKTAATDPGTFLTPICIQAVSAAGLDPRETRKATGNPSARDWLRDHVALYDATKATEWEKQILAIAGAYDNPMAFGGVNYVTQLKLLYINGQMGSPGQYNDDIFGLLAFAAGNHPTTSTESQGMVANLRAWQRSDGGWGFGPGASSDVDLTAAAIAALVAGGVQPGDAAIHRALNFLRDHQTTAGGFSMDTSPNLQTTAWVLWGLKSVGEDPASGAWAKNGNTGVSWLESRIAADGVPLRADGSRAGLWEACDILLGLSTDRYPTAAYVPAAPRLLTKQPHAGEHIELDDPLRPELSLWSFGDGATGSGNPASHTYAMAGTYTIHYTARSGDYGKNASRIFVEVAPAPPIASIDASRSTANRYTPVTFSALNSHDPDGAIAAYEWRFGDGHIIPWGDAAVTDHAYSTPGLFVVTLRVRDGDGLEATSTATLTVVNAVPSIELRGGERGNRTHPLTFSAVVNDSDDGQNLPVQWFINGDLVGDGTTLTRRFPLLGVFSVEAKTSDPHGAVASARTNVTIHNEPPTIRDLQWNQTGAQIVNFTASVEDDSDNLQYFWLFGDGESQTTSNPYVLHAYESPGTYDISLQVTDDDNMTRSRQTTLRIPAEASADEALQDDNPQVNSPPHASTATPPVANPADQQSDESEPAASSQRSDSTIVPQEENATSARPRLLIERPAQYTKWDGGPISLRGTVIGAPVAKVAVWTSGSKNMTVANPQWELSIQPEPSESVVIHLRAVANDLWSDQITLQLDYEMPAQYGSESEQQESGSDDLEATSRQAAQGAARDTPAPGVGLIVIVAATLGLLIPQRLACPPNANALEPPAEGRNTRRCDPLASSRHSSTKLRRPNRPTRSR